MHRGFEDNDQADRSKQARFITGCAETNEARPAGRNQQYGCPTAFATKEKIEWAPVMKLVDARNAYYEFSGKVSDISRALALAGIALIWVFKIDSKDGPHVPHELILPAFVLVLALSADFLHYVVATFAWGMYHRYKEKKGATEKDQFLAPRWINWPTTLFSISTQNLFCLFCLYPLTSIPMG